MLKNFVAEAVNAPGTTQVVNLGGNLTGRLAFGGVFTNGQSTFYFMEDGAQAEWGLGIFNTGSPNTYNRQTVLGNSLGTTVRLNFAGVTRLYNEIPAERAVYLDPAGNLQVEGRKISSIFWGGTSTGTSTAYTVGLTPAVTGYSGGFEFRFRAHATCGDNPTCDAGQGPKPIRKPTNYGIQALAGGEIVAGQLIHTIYDPTTDTFVLCGPAPGGIHVPIGTFIIGGWTTLPPGCLWPDGRNVSRTTYAQLFSAYSTQFGAGDGTTTFGLPDLRGRSIFGRDNLGGTSAGRLSGVIGASTTLGAVGGDQWLHAHAHGVNDPGHAHSGWTDAQGWHAHNVTEWYLVGNGAFTGSIAGGGNFDQTTMNVGTDGQGNHGHNVGTHAAGTGIWLSNNGSGGSQNLPPLFIGNIAIYAGAA